MDKCYFSTFLKFVNVPLEELYYFDSLIKVHSGSKGMRILSEGEVCQRIFYFMKGGCRQFLMDDEGAEHCNRFLFETGFTTSLDSFFSQSPSRESIELLEDSEYFTLEYSQVKHLIARNFLWERLYMILMEQLCAIKFRREKLLSIKDPLKRYCSFLEFGNIIIRRVSQKHIASYLGISPETLSRIKKRIQESDQCKLIA